MKIIKIPFKIPPDLSRQYIYRLYSAALSYSFGFEASYFLAAWAHLACALSDPGAVPRGAAEVLAPPEAGMAEI